MSESSPPRDVIQRTGDPQPPASPGRALRNIIAARDMTAFIGVYDAFSATVAGQHYDSIFVSGYGFAASHYGLPDVGFIAWSDMLSFVQRLRSILPRHHILVDLDDGYGDPDIAAHVAAMMESAGASGIVLEDQQRPRRCGHSPGKQVLPLDQYLEKLRRVLAARRDLFVVARTDAADDDERLRRCQAFDDAGADAVLADGIEGLAALTRISRGVRKPVMFNQIAGGRSPRCTLAELRIAGVSLVNYSTPCLFAAGDAMNAALQTLKSNGGLLADVRPEGLSGLSGCTTLLQNNLAGLQPHGTAAVVATPPSATSTRPPTFADKSTESRIQSLSPVKQKLLAAVQAKSSKTAPLVHHREAAAAPLSRTQKLFYFTSQIDPSHVALNTTRCLRLTGPVDAARLSRAFSQVVARHAILRTVYELDVAAGEPRQRVLQPEVAALPVINLSGYPAGRQFATVNDAIIADARLPFDLKNGPVYRAWITCLAPTEYLLTLTVHHIAFDGWSAGVLLRDLAAAYASPDAAVPDASLQYSDYAAWQHAHDQTSEASAAHQEAIRYWIGRLAGITPLAIPADHTRPAMLSARGARHTVSFPAEIAMALRGVARDHNATLFIVLLAGFKALLHRLGDSIDLIVGTYVSARERVECESLIGPFINTLVVRTQVDEQGTFSGFLARVRLAALEAMKHSVLPFDELIRIAKVSRDPSRNALYDIAFQLRNFPRPAATAGDVTLSSEDRDNGIARCDLQLLAEEHGDRIDLTFEYCTDLFEPPRVQQMALQLLAAYRAVAARPDVLLSELLPPATESETARATVVPSPTVSSTPVLTRTITPTQRKLAALWAEVLDVSDISVEDDFFEIGGHSLRAVVCAARVHEAFGVELPVIEFFKTPTLGAMAASIDLRTAPTAGPAPVSPAEAFSNLSPGQERLWFLNEYEKDCSVYNVCLTRRLQGPLDSARLERALNVVVGRHEALRTKFVASDGVPSAQIVDADAAVVHIELNEHAAIAAADRHSIIDDAVLQSMAARFDLATFPLLRARLLRFAADDHVLVLTLHHIVCDEWSLRILLDELSAAYAADANPLPRLVQQYRHVAAKQLAWLAGPAAAAEAKYWISHLSDAPAVLALPTDHPRPPTQTFRGGYVPIALNSELVQKIRSVGRRAQSTDFMTTLALFYLLLARWSRQRDVVVGAPIANRPRSEEQALIGYLLNTLPIRVRVPEQGTFSDLLRSVREAALGALTHQQLPFEKIIEAVKPPRSLGHSPLFQVLFVLRTEGDGELNLPGVDASLVRARGNGAKFDLSLLLSTENDRIGGVLEYNTDLFDRSTAESIASRYVLLAEAVCANPDAPLATLLAADEAETLTLLHQFNRPARPAQGTVLDLWAEQVRRTPSAAAVISGAKSLSYKELDAQSTTLAGELLRQGASTEDRVGLYLTRSPHAMVSLLGVMKAGAAYVPLDPSYPPERLAMIADDAGISLVLSESLLAGAPLLNGRRSILLDQEIFAALGGPLPVVTPDQLAYVLFTSGSTGRPKGVAMTHGPAWHLARWQRAHSACNGETRTLQFTSLNFDVSFQEIFSTWCGGGTLVLIDDIVRRDPDALLAHIVATGIDRLFLPFVALQSLAEAAVKPTAPTCQLREVMTAGEQLRVTPSLVKWFASMPSCKLFNQYGPTETHVINTSLELPSASRTWPVLPSIGRPIDHSRLYVLDERRRLLPIGSPGDLYVGGACVARGYLNRDDLTAAAFVPDPYSDTADARMYKTGDLARWTADGTVHYLGRSDAQVKVQGYRVELGEIENALSRYPGVRQAAVIARDDSSGMKRLIAYVVADAAPDLKALRKHLSKTLPAYMMPAKFVRLDQMPLTGSNKIDRGALPDPAGRSLEADGQGRHASGPFETSLLEIWRDVLGQKSIGVNDNFFDIGGQSLLAVRVFSRIADRFDKTLPLSALYGSPTVAQLATLLEDKPPAAEDLVVIPLQPDGARPPLFCLGGIDGHVFNYRSLARLLAPDQPVYGLQVDGVDTDSPTLERIEDIAAFLIRHVRRVQPSGPYAMIGYSFGGVVGFEMARQLRAAGERVRLLAMLDTFATFEFPRKNVFGRAVVHVRRAVKAGPANAAGYLARRITELNRRLCGTYTLPAVVMPSASPQVNAAMSRVRQAGAHALRQYEPQSYDGEVTLFRAIDRPAWHDFLIDRPFNGWNAFAAGVRVHPIPGTHATLLEGAQVEQIAAILKAALRPVANW